MSENETKGICLTIQNMYVCVFHFNIRDINQYDQSEKIVCQSYRNTPLIK